MKQFTTQPNDSVPLRPYESMLDGHKLVAWRPKNAALLELAGLDESVRAGDRVAMAHAIQRFMEIMLDVASLQHVRNRLLDPDDYFDIEHLIPIMDWLREELGTEEDGEEGGAPTVPTGPSGASWPTSGSTGRISSGRSLSQEVTGGAGQSPTSVTPSSPGHTRRMPTPPTGS